MAGHSSLAGLQYGYKLDTSSAQLQVVTRLQLVGLGRDNLPAVY